MSRRLNKTSRTRKLTGTVAVAAANLPTPKPDGLGVLFARNSARKTTLRSSLLVGTALSAGILAGLGGVIVGARPAMAGSGTHSCTIGGAGPNYIWGFSGGTGTQTCTVTFDNTGNYSHVTGVAGAFSSDGDVANASLTVSNSGTLEGSPIGLHGVSFARAPAGFGATVVGGDATATTTVTNTGTVYDHFIDVDGVAITDANAFHAGTATGGTANATTSITNSGTLSDARIGISGFSLANANGLFAGTATGGLAEATTEIDSTDPTIEDVGVGVAGLAVANANGLFAHIATGGDAIAGVTITNSADINYAGVGIVGRAVANANGLFTGTGTGGTATADVTITNIGTLGSLSATTPTFAYLHHGIVGYSSADANGRSVDSNAHGGTANATTSVSNAGNIYSNGRVITGGAFAESDAHAFDGNAYGGTSSAAVVISNTATTSTSTFGRGIYGNSFAKANGGAWGDDDDGVTGMGGDATATTTISNGTGTVTSAGTVIDGEAGAVATGFGGGFGTGPYIGTGGTATAGVTITNAGTLTSTYGRGIAGYSFADADGRSIDGTAAGGTATATTSITNSGNISSAGRVIAGYAFAESDAHAFDGDATGGTANATVTISNTADTSTSTFGHGISGNSFAKANGGAWGGDGDGVTGMGGDATAMTTISNGTGTVTSAGTALVGIAGAEATGFGGGFGSGPYIGTGGTATATVYITNAGTLTSGDHGIFGGSSADADGRSIGGTATGGTADATTSITNSGNIDSDGRVIVGDAYAKADAHAFNGDATGGTANATVTISNTADTSFSVYGRGISGDSNAEANGSAWGFEDSDGVTGMGGDATAMTTISNTGSVTSPWTVIVGEATATATGFGGGFGFAGSPTGPYIGTGGTATATVNITNMGTLVSASGDGIQGETFANANGDSKFDEVIGEDPPVSTTGVGGTASATTSITNAGAIGSSGDGIDGVAVATANGNSVVVLGQEVEVAEDTFIFEPIQFLLGTKGVGGTANADVTISNTGNIDSKGYDGINGFAGAWADGRGYNATGGTATATTNIYNSGKIITPYAPGISGNLGINGTAIAAASAHGAYGVFGGATAGTATAGVTIDNTASGTIDTFDPFSPGIAGFAGAFANGDGFMGVGGVATASTTITNAGEIVTHLWGSPGISAGAIATAEGNFLNGTGGTAVATTTVSNSGTITTYHGWSAGIDAFSEAYTSGFIAEGSATATTTVTNSGTITTFDHNSAGIAAYSSAEGDAAASTTVSNSGTMTTNGASAPGVNAQSFAYDALNGATATTTVTNSGTITTTGSGSSGVFAYAGAVSLLGAASATITVNNSGVIHTYGKFSNAITANVYTLGSTTMGSITVNNAATGSIIASGYPFHAVAAYGASTTINNAGYIHGNVQLPAFVNTFNNSGSWVMQGDSQFGGNPNTAVNNSGTVSMVDPGSTLQASPDVATAGQNFHVVTLNGLETFNNYSGTTGGLITMVDGQANDRIVISNVTGQQVFFNGGTNSDPSRLAVDAFLGGPGSAADVLQVGKVTGQGYVTGVTQVIVNDINPGPGAFNSVGIPVAESGGAANTTVTVNGQQVAANVAGNFTSATIDKGLFQYNLFYLPQNASKNPCQSGFNCWFLGETPSTTAFELPRLVTAAQEIWRDTAGTWLDRTADLRDYYFGTAAPLVTKEGPVPAQSFGVGPGVWVRAFGDWGSNNGTANWSAYGQTLSHDVNFNQNTGGVQLGADYPVFNMVNGTLLVGAMGGAVDSTVSFASGTHATFQGGDAGAYATYLNHNFFVDSLFLANLMSLDFNGGGSDGSGVSTGTNSNLTQYGGHLDMGYRFQFHPWFIEPEATVEYVHTEFGNMTFPGATAYLDDNAVFGRLGGRIGTTMNVDGYLVEPSITGGVWQNFTGSNFVTLASNGYSFDLTDPNSARTIGEFGAMLNLLRRDGWSGFLKGDYYFATGFDDFSLQGGVRYQW